MTHRYTPQEIETFTQAVLNDGYCLLSEHFSPATLKSWQEAFKPLLEEHIAREGRLRNRGAARYYVTLPFSAPFADPSIYEDEDILAIVERLVGEDAVMCQLATDTPLLGSDYQDVHRDTLPLFPETDRETPPYQLAVNFPLIDVTLENGPLEITRGTHRMSKADGLERMESGDVKLEPITMRLGDVMIRDVRGLIGVPQTTLKPPVQWLSLAIADAGCFALRYRSRFPVLPLIPCLNAPITCYVLILLSNPLTTSRRLRFIRHSPTRSNTLRVKDDLES